MELHQNIRSADDSRYSLIIEDKVQKITQEEYESDWSAFCILFERPDLFGTFSASEIHPKTDRFYGGCQKHHGESYAFAASQNALLSITIIL